MACTFFLTVLLGFIVPDLTNKNATDIIYKKITTPSFSFFFFLFYLTREKKCTPIELLGPQH
jgi:hypothetical protein